MEVGRSRGELTAARAIQLAEIDNGEAVDGHIADTVVLEDLVVGALGTAADDLGVTVTLEGKSV